MTEPVSIPLDQIEVGDRLRKVSPDDVALIAESYQVNGQLTPIEVRREGDGYALVIGAHRLAAAHQLQWPAIEAHIFTGSKAQARLREIDENLCRRELSELDRAAFLAERKRVWLELHPETAQGRAKKGSGKPDNVVRLFPAFADDVAEKLGVSRRSVDRAVRRYTGLDAKVRDQLALTPFAHRASELDALCRLDAPTQRKVVGLLLREKNPAKSVAAAHALATGKTPTEVDPAEQQLQALMRAWQRAGTKARRRFLTMAKDDLAVLGATVEAA